MFLPHPFSIFVETDQSDSPFQLAPKCKKEKKGMKLQEIKTLVDITNHLLLVDLVGSAWWWGLNHKKMLSKYS